MERLGLVSQLEGELERSISLGMMPRDGLMPSEQTLAEKYRVSRATAREALVRLSVRGLVVQHPGRKARAVAWEQAMTLENLGMALHGVESTHPERRRFLEGFLALKRDVTVELLVASCEHADKEEMDRLTQACFALADVVRWRHQRHEWMEREFEFLREAAMAAGRVGYYLLIQSLERAYRDVASKVLPHLEAEAVNQWAEFAFFALEARNVQALRTELPQLMRANDKHVLRGLAAACRTQETLKSHSVTESPLTAAATPEVGNSTPEPAGSAPESFRPAPRAGGLCADESSPEVRPAVPVPAGEGGCVDEASFEVEQSAPVSAEARRLADEQSSEGVQSAPVPGEVGPGADGAGSLAGQSVPAPAKAGVGAGGSSPDVGQAPSPPTGAQGSGALGAIQSGCQTRSRKAQPDRALPEPAFGSAYHPPGSMVREADPSSAPLAMPD
jgi:GntR family transcriptional repressor for pyruvate dehydrogenase complex